MELPRPTFAQFRTMFDRRWKQGEHVFISSQTGGGKTELMLKLLEISPGLHYDVLFCTKPRDPIFRTPQARQYRKIPYWAKREKHDKRVMLSPLNFNSSGETRVNQAGVFRDALDQIYFDGGWTVGIDETAWLAESLGLARPIADQHHMGRALGITLVTATQRPKRLPVIVPQSATYAFIGKTMRRDDQNTLAELGGDTRATRAAIESLTGRHDFLFVDTLGREPLQIVDTRA